LNICKNRPALEALPSDSLYLRRLRAMTFWSHLWFGKFGKRGGRP